MKISQNKHIGAAGVEAEISRRGFVSGLGAVALLAPLSMMLTACGPESTAGAAQDDGSAVAGSAQGASESPTAGSASADAPATGTGSTLVAYFSATGNTEGIAAAIAEHTGADVLAITPAQAYTDADLNYSDDASRTSVERAEGAQPELAQVTPDAFETYDTVYLGYPIWWGEAAWPLRTFVANNDFSGKTVVPFCTSASSGFGRSGELLAELAGTGEWVEGARFSGGAPAADVTAWVDGLGLS